MIKPYSPIRDQEVKAEHLRSHAQAIEWLYSRVKKNRSEQKIDSTLNQYDYYYFNHYKKYEFALDSRPVNGIKSAIIKGGPAYSNYVSVDVPDFVIDLASPLVKFLWVRVDVVARFFFPFHAPGFFHEFPGIFDFDFTSFYQITPGISVGDSYPQGLAPDSITGIGHHIEPLGRLTVENGEATFEHLNYGAINIHQCSGNIYGRRIP